MVSSTSLRARTIRASKFARRTETSVLHGCCRSQSFEASGGFSFEGGITRLRLSASHKESDPLLTGEREFLERARALQLQNNPAAYYGSPTPPFGYTTNIRNSGANQNVNSRLKPQYGGTVLSSPSRQCPWVMRGSPPAATRRRSWQCGQYNCKCPKRSAPSRAC